MTGYVIGLAMIISTWIVAGTILKDTNILIGAGILTLMYFGGITSTKTN